ncbi:MAG: hypothetical protein M3464_19735 [Chloroflexota bacterium]|nr:hypothetical protein [Chloroflexota bacterium]
MLHTMQTDVTRPQLAVVTILTLLALVAAIVWSASYANLAIGAHDVEGVVMAPGMIMTRDMPAAAMRDMAAVNPNTVRSVAPPDAQGDQTLEPQIEDGIKVFDLETRVFSFSYSPRRARVATGSRARARRAVAMAV